MAAFLEARAASMKSHGITGCSTDGSRLQKLAAEGWPCGHHRLRVLAAGRERTIAIRALMRTRSLDRTIAPGVRRRFRIRQCRVRLRVLRRFLRSAGSVSFSAASRSGSSSLPRLFRL